MIRLVFTQTNSTTKFHDGCCLYRLGLFIKLFFRLLLSCAAFEKARLVNTYFIINNKIIAYCFLFICIISFAMAMLLGVLISSGVHAVFINR